MAYCPFCSLPPSRIISEDSLTLVIRDGFPVSPGHSLIIPKRHCGSFFELTDKERTSLFRQLTEAKAGLDVEFRPDGYNIGINDGVAAGQTVFHLHVHLIPRYHGDLTDPRSGVRWILPGKASYWNEPDRHIAKYSVFNIKELLDNLHERARHSVKLKR